MFTILSCLSVAMVMMSRSLPGEALLISATLMLITIDIGTRTAWSRLGGYGITLLFFICYLAIELVHLQRETERLNNAVSDLLLFHGEGAIRIRESLKNDRRRALS
jgi:hypothetical protein